MKESVFLSQMALDNMLNTVYELVFQGRNGENYLGATSREGSID